MDIKWNSVNEESPEEEGDILVLINGKLFFGSVNKVDGKVIILYEENHILYELDRKVEGIYPMVINGRGWVYPKHFKKPTHWMPLPKLPKEEMKNENN